MNVLFLSLGEFTSFDSGSVHIDLIKEFAKHHNVFLVCKREKREGKNTEIEIVDNRITVLRVRTGNIKRVGLLEKGLSTITVETRFIHAIKKYLNNVKFDLIVYTTPPITFEKVVSFIKERDGAIAYLALKDIFPQNALDLGMMKESGFLGIIYRYFRKKEISLYKASDRIGCMSPANREYILNHNPYIDRSKVEILPNCISIVERYYDNNERLATRRQYGIPEGRKVFIYGGNLGKPQGIPFLAQCLLSQKDNERIFFVIAGKGTEYDTLRDLLSDSEVSNTKLLPHLQKDEYEKLVASCDVGLLFLDHRFTIPNYPSRLLSYMQAAIPVLACTDSATDVGTIAEREGYGWWCESNDVEAFNRIIERIQYKDTTKYGSLAYKYLVKHYSVENAYRIIMDSYLALSNSD